MLEIRLPKPNKTIETGTEEVGRETGMKEKKAIQLLCWFLPKKDSYWDSAVAEISMQRHVAP